MAFEKDFNDSREYFVLNSSLLNGPDILSSANENPVQYWDYYRYNDYRDRLQSLSWSSSLSFPHSIQAAFGDVVFNNFDNFFTPRTYSPIAQYILPGRPIKILAGYGNETSIQQFVGTTQGKPKLDPVAKTASFRALGFIAEIAAMRLSETIALSNIRTDEALVVIFNQFGIPSSAYSLDRGRNTIPFLFLEGGSTVGDVLFKIMEAEGGKLFVDESGLIRFVQRLTAPSGPVFTFNETNVVSAEQSDETQIINRIVIRSSIRQVQDFQPVFFGSGISGNATLTEPLLVKANSTASYDIALGEPLSSFNEPILGQLISDSWFTALNASGLSATNNIEITSTLLTVKNLNLTFQNTNSYDIYVDAMEVWGRPAKVVDTIIYEAKDQASIDEHGEHVYETTNDLFGNEPNCESFAYTVLDAYAQPGTIVELQVKGDYSLQLSDVVWLDLDDLRGAFQIIGISYNVLGNGIDERLQVKRYNPRRWFTLNQSILNGTDVLAP